MERHMMYDDSGNALELLVRRRFKMGNENYIALLVADDIHSPTFIMRVEKDYTGTEKLTLLERDELLQAQREYEKINKNYIQ